MWAVNLSLPLFILKAFCFGPGVRSAYVPSFGVSVPGNVPVSFSSDQFGNLSPVPLFSSASYGPEVSSSAHSLGSVAQTTSLNAASQPGNLELPPAVLAYASTFDRAVQGSSILKSVMELANLSGTVIGDVFHRATHSFLSNLGNTEAVSHAQGVLKTVVGTFDEFTASSYPKILGICLGNFLIKRGLLNLQNASAFANAYASEIVNAVNGIGAHDSQSYAQGILQSLYSFLTPLGISLENSFEELNAEFEDAMRYVTKN